jgi:predicted nucleic acid-binding protein
MTFDELRNGEAIFLDANIFVYHFLGLSEQCKQLLKRCREGVLQGTTASFIVAETVHRLMVAEAVEQKLVTRKNALKKLRERPELVQQLRKYAQSVPTIRAMNIESVALTTATVEASAAVRQQYGLLTNDSILVTVMRELGLTRLATLDKDFDRVEWLGVYKPTDV